MLKTIEQRLAYEERDLESCVRSFETANLGDQSADIESFLPSDSHPQYLAILGELIRLDMEFSWARGTPNRLPHFLQRYPAVFADASTFQEIAFEEFRLRLGNGEQPSAAEYAARYGIDCANWSQSDELDQLDQLDPSLLPVQAADEQIDLTRVTLAPSPDQEMRDAAMAYTLFRLSDGWSGPDESAIDFSQSIRAESDASDFFRELHETDPDAACRMAQASAVMPQVGTRFLDFELVAELGCGTFGRVFLAKQGTLAGRSVAIKITAERSVESGALAQLQHTHIVPVYSVHRSGPFHAVVMPYFGSATLVDLLHDLKGQDTRPQSGTALVSTLHAKIQGGKERSRQSAAAVATLRPNGTLTENDEQAEVGYDHPKVDSRPVAAPSEVLQTLGDMSYVQALLWIGARIADALAHAHERGILHRDLKPANILLTDQGPMLLDFNLAADTKVSTQATAARLGGTLPYMAPEHLEAFRDASLTVDGRCDIYSLGVILYELLGGRRPFSTPRGPMKDVLQVMIDQRRSPVRSLSSLNRAVTPAIEAIVERCLQTNPAMRYQSARQLQEDLHRHLNDLPLLHVSEPSIGERGAKWYRRNRKGVFRAAIGASTAAVFILGALIVHNEQDRARLAAADQQQTLSKKIQSSDVFANVTRTKNSEEMRKAREGAEDWIKDYRVLDDPQWKELPAIANLEPETRAVLLQDMGLMLLSLAQSQLLEARSARDESRHLDKVQLYFDRAEDCYPSGQAPRVLWLMRADLAKLSGDDSEAERLQKLAAGTPVESPADRLALARYDFSLGRLDRAIPALKQVTEEDSRSILAWGYLGDAYSRMARYSEAVPCFTVCIALAPSVNRFRFDRAQTYFNLSDFNAALADYDEIVRRDPQDVDALLYRSLTYRNLNKYPEALADLKSAATRPDAPEARIHFQASIIYGLMKDNESAELENDLGLKAPATAELDWIARGLSGMNKHPEQAVEAFDRALQIAPGSLGTLRNKAAILSKQEHNAKAVEVLDEALRLYPGSVLARTSRGTLLARLGRRDLAIKDAEECLRLDPRPMIRYRVAGIYASTSRQHAEDAFLALGNLAAALAGGYGADLVPSDPDLNPIRSMPEFKNLWASTQVVRDTAKHVKVR
jgi:eukaryotic-like serine/threonine-protein kinase